MPDTFCGILWLAPQQQTAPVLRIKKLSLHADEALADAVFSRQRRLQATSASAADAVSAVVNASSTSDSRFQQCQ